MGNLLDYIYIVPAALIAIILHELAHGLMSYWLGDPTPKRQGRLSLNPLNHLDLVGTLCLIFFHVGWAKPVVINPEYYKKKKLGFPVPLREWVREEELYKEIKEKFNSETAEKYFDIKRINKLLEDHKSGKKDCYKKVWTIYTFIVWYNEYFKEA